MRAGASAVFLATLLVAACSDLSGLSGEDTVTNPDGGPDQSAPPTDSGAGGDSGEDASTTTLDAACADLAEAICSRLTVCAPSIVQTFSGGPVACETQQKLACMIQQSAPGVLMTMPQLAQCTADVGAVT